MGRSGVSSLTTFFRGQASASGLPGSKEGKGLFAMTIWFWKGVGNHPSVEAPRSSDGS